jgi:ribonuclease HI
VFIIDIYVDGSYRKGKTSSAIIVVDEEVLYKKVIVKQNDFSIKYRNFYSELFSSIMAVQYCKTNDIDTFTIYHDYSGIEHLITGKWKLKNELSKRYYELFYKLVEDRDYKFQKVKSHTGDLYNEMVDKLAYNALKF